MGNGMNKIIPGVYVGNFRDAKDAIQLKDNKITHILSIHDNAKPLHEDKKYLCIIASDTPDQPLTQHFPECIEFIHRARLERGRVLIHCLAGVSRSVTVTAAYIMTVTNLGWRDSVNAIRGARSCANPNFGFQRQLQDYENERLETARKELRMKFPDYDRDDQKECEILLKSYKNFLATGETRNHPELYSLPHRAYGERFKPNTETELNPESEPNSGNTSNSHNKTNSKNTLNLDMELKTDSEINPDLENKPEESEDGLGNIKHTAEAFSELEFGAKQKSACSLENNKSGPSENGALENEGDDSD